MELVLVSVELWKLRNNRLEHIPRSDGTFLGLAVLVVAKKAWTPRMGPTRRNAEFLDMMFVSKSETVLIATSSKTANVDNVGDIGNVRKGNAGRTFKVLSVVVAVVGLRQHDGP